MTDSLLTPDDLCKRWHVTKSTLSQWRWSAKGPPYLKVGRQIFYRPLEVEKFEERMSRRHTAEKK